MSTLAEIEAVIPQLAPEELARLERLIHSRRLLWNPSPRKSAFDLPPLRLGAVLRPLSAEDDLLEDARD